MKDIKKLQHFLDWHPNNIIKLMLKFNVTSTSTISCWKVRGLPRKKRIQILKYIERPQT